MNDESLMPFGKFKGIELANVPADYLIWLYDNNKCYGDLKSYIEENRKVLEMEVSKTKKQ